MKKFWKCTLGRFGADQKGSLAIEAVFAMPMLFWAATALFTFYDAFKVQNTSFRANYTISDMLSRETDAIDLAYMDGIHKVFRYMTHSGVEDSWIRVSVVTCTDNCTSETNRVLKFDWSQGASGARPLGDADLVAYRDRIPLMAIGSRLIFVETSREYIPPFANALVSFLGRDLVTYAITRPRFAPQLCWVSCGGGSGTDGSDGIITGA